jgi:hypothetical protein
MARRPTTPATSSQGSLDQGMVPLPDAGRSPESAQPEAVAYLDAIEALGKSVTAVQLAAPADDLDDLRRVIAILRSVYRRERARSGSVL